MCGSVLVCLNMCATALTLACHSNSQQLLSAVRAHTRIKSIYIYFFSAVFAFATLHMEQKYEKRNKINFLLCKCSFLYLLYFLRTFMLLPVTNLPQLPHLTTLIYKCVYMFINIQVYIYIYIFIYFKIFMSSCNACHHHLATHLCKAHIAIVTPPFYCVQTMM